MAIRNLLVFFYQNDQLVLFYLFPDKANILGFVELLVSKYVLPGSCTGQTSSEVLGSILDFLLCVLDVPVISANLSFISSLYASVFELTDLR